MFIQSSIKMGLTLPLYIYLYSQTIDTHISGEKGERGWKGRGSDRKRMLTIDRREERERRGRERRGRERRGRERKREERERGVEP